MNNKGHDEILSKPNPGLQNILIKYVTSITKELAIILRTMEGRRHFQRLKKDKKLSLEMKINGIVIAVI